MSARHKLNSANMYFCVMMAGLVGLLMGGWGWFALADVPDRAADDADQDPCAMGPSPARAMV